MSYLDGYSQAIDILGFAKNHDAACDKANGWEGIKGSCKRTKKKAVSQKTQRGNTTPSYTKAKNLLDSLGVKGKILDYGAGKGFGTKALGRTAESFEPFPPDDFKPDYGDEDQIPAGKYDGVVSLNVLNVLEKKERDTAVLNMAKSLKPGGYIVIGARGTSVPKEAPRARKGAEAYSVILSDGRYQKGFSQKELNGYIGDTLSKDKKHDYQIATAKVAAVGVVVQKQKKGNA